MRPKNDERKMDVYHFVTSFMKERGVCPTTLEIGNTLGMAKSTVSKYMNRLVEEGLIEKYGRYQTITADNFSYTRMPIVGAIACGAPTLSIEDIEGYLPVDEASLGPGGDGSDGGSGGIGGLSGDGQTRAANGTASQQGD
jgi:SOS-response transcriptional repressor LexA